jgi:hypothetical protein
MKQKLKLTFNTMSDSEKSDALFEHYNNLGDHDKSKPCPNLYTCSGKQIYGLEFCGMTGLWTGYVAPPTAPNRKLRLWHPNGDHFHGNDNMNLDLNLKQCGPKPVPEDKQWQDCTTQEKVDVLMGVVETVAASPAPAVSKTPAHYAGAVTPWDLQKCMQSSGDAFVDARRTDAIEYAFRLKDNLEEDLGKAIHCLQAALERLNALKQKP